MTAEQYRRWSAPFRTPGREAGLNRLNFLLTRLCYAAYPLALLWLAFHRDGRGLPALVIPAVSFVLLSVFRHCYNAPRPYELLDIQPLIHKDKRGKSFPSRHVFSVFIIAITFLWLWPPLGGVFLVVGVLLAACRVIGGVHFPRDVIAGALFALLAGGIYWLLP